MLDFLTLKILEQHEFQEDSLVYFLAVFNSNKNSNGSNTLSEQVHRQCPLFNYFTQTL